MFEEPGDVADQRLVCSDDVFMSVQEVTPNCLRRYTEPTNRGSEPPVSELQSNRRPRRRPPRQLTAPWPRTCSRRWEGQSEAPALLRPDPTHTQKLLCASRAPVFTALTPVSTPLRRLPDIDDLIYSRICVACN